MGAVKLELHCRSPRVNGIAADPEPDWSFDALVSELNALETKLAATSTEPSSLNKTKSRGNEIQRGRTFILNAHAYDMEDTESEDDDVNDGRTLAVDGKRITCDELYLSDSDDSDVVSVFEVQPYLMDEVEELEGALLELTHEHQLRVKDEIRSKISVLETALVNESQNSTSSLLRVEKYKETRQELDKKFDTQYQRRIAEELDSHLTAVQQDREHRSQIEERKIRNDAANEEAKRKIALQEEKQQQEKAKAEVEAKLRAEEAKQAALEAERKAVTEAKRKAAMEAEKRATAEAERRAEKETVGNSKSFTAGVTQQEAAGRLTDTASSLPNVETKESGNVYQAAANALNLEHGRLQKLSELCQSNQLIRSNSNKDYTRHENHILRLIKTIRGSRDSVRSKASELINLLNDRQYPQSISVETFAKKVVSNCTALCSAPFAKAYVIVYVTSQVPHAMDILLAELHRVCPYTVPKHMVYRKSTFKSKEEYFKSIGYWEENGKMESTGDYLQRLESYVKLYAALVQTEINDAQNLHGLQHGWTWLARFMNYLPANTYTAVSLHAFLQMAGFALHRRYKSQFLKMLNVISENFLVDLKSLNVPGMNTTVVAIQSYIEDKMFRQEPEGRSLQTNLLSKEFVVR